MKIEVLFESNYKENMFCKFLLIFLICLKGQVCFLAKLFIIFRASHGNLHREPFQGGSGEKRKVGGFNFLQLHIRVLLPRSQVLSCLNNYSSIYFRRTKVFQFINFL